MERNDNNRIAIVLSYYGSFPAYFQRWLNCVKNNPRIDFYLITDSNKVSDSDNLFVIKWSFSELKSHLQALFDYRISLKSPYKLCDYKPVYGLLLKDRLKDYEYWGYIDCDLIFGDIMSFIEPVLGKYDRVGLSGHFSIMKNDEKWINYFRYDGIEMREVYASNEVYTSNHNFAYDELGGGRFRYGLSYLQIKRNERVISIDNHISDINILYKNFNSVRDCKPINNEVFEYDNGKMYSIYKDISGTVSKEEIMYAHFQKRSIEDKSGSQDHYYITPFGVEYVFNSDEFPKLVPEEDVNIAYAKSVKRKILKDRIRRGSIKYILIDRILISQANGIILDPKACVEEL